MFKQIDYVMIIVSDMARSIEFYRDKLGIPLKFQSPDWTEFLTGTTTLALHGGGIPRPAKGGSADKDAGSCSIGFNVDDVDNRSTRAYGEPPQARKPLATANGLWLSGSCCGECWDPLATANGSVR